MQKEEILLNTLFKNVEFVRTKRNEIENIKSNRKKEIDIFKFELIEVCLQPLLINVLVGKKETSEFNALMADILKSKITIVQQNDEFLLKFRLKNAIARNNCVSPQGFMLKYQFLLKSNKEFDFLTILQIIMRLNISNNEQELVLKMFQEFVNLFREDKQLNFERLNTIYLQLIYQTNASILKLKSMWQCFTHIELIICEKLEEIIIKSVSSEQIKDFEDLFYSLLKQRVKEVEDDYKEILFRKNGFYNQIQKLSNEFKNDEDKAKKVTFILAYSNGTMGKEKSKELTNEEKEFF